MNPRGRDRIGALSSPKDLSFPSTPSLQVTYSGRPYPAVAQTYQIESVPTFERQADSARPLLFVLLGGLLILGVTSLYLPA
jgi:hypothetical protein